MLRSLASSSEPTSFANKLRSKRFRKFEALTTSLPRPLCILDVGGTNAFWENRGWHERNDVEILTLNLSAEQQCHANIKPLAGDATNLSEFADQSIDIVFSNSVIEHLFTFENQKRMAVEVQRVGKAFWIQTPSFWFPIEPHFHFIGWQWLPISVRTALLQKRSCGWRGPCPDPIESRRQVEEVRLLSRAELQTLFPNATLIPESFCGLVKSYTAVSGFH
jgi:Methyltransferase domain